MKWHPAGYRIIIKPTLVEEVSKGGIVLATDIKEKEDLEVCEVVELGSEAYNDTENGSPWCKVGDMVLIQRYAGKLLPHSKECLRIINDKDIIAIGEIE